MLEYVAFGYRKLTVRQGRIITKSGFSVVKEVEALGLHPLWGILEGWRARTFETKCETESPGVLCRPPMTVSIQTESELLPTPWRSHDFESHLRAVTTVQLERPEPSVNPLQSDGSG